ncbi:MAG: polymer-forming cytoskeletal protein [Saprospiraceae bacterium]|nr:polymer-forming cytoskeletal protein [Saprospiraceae bacterium]
MFGKKENSTTTTVQRSSTSSAQHNSLVAGTRVEGTITSENDFRIDGVFVGNLTCKARVIIGPAGNFNGDIVCQNAIIEGTFNGKLDIHDVLEVREGAVIEGDVTTGKLQVQAGSVFDVKCVMGERNSPPAALKEEIMIDSLVEESNGEVK